MQNPYNGIESVPLLDAPPMSALTAVNPYNGIERMSSGVRPGRRSVRF